MYIEHLDYATGVLTVKYGVTYVLIATRDYDVPLETNKGHANSGYALYC